MQCFHPVQAWRLADGGVVFAERGDVYSSINLPCGRCHGCRLERARQWSVRLMHEASLYDVFTEFVTLTYRDLGDGSLHYRDFRLFIKRIRKAGFKVRYFVAGEYGANEDGERCLCRVCKGERPVCGRPHFHAILFGVRFWDRKEFKKSDAGFLLYTSETLERFWPHGFSSCAGVTQESCQYVAKYSLKKITGDVADDHYRRIHPETGEVYYLEPEFCHMSLKPGIGARWFSRFGRDVYPHDHVVVGGVRGRPPKYYDVLGKRLDAGMIDDIKAQRELRGYQLRDDNTESRLAVKEKVAIAAGSFSKRRLNK